MALDSWLNKIRAAVASGIAPARAPSSGARAGVKNSTVGILAFELAGLMSNLLRLWLALSDESLARTRTHALSLYGVRIVVSEDDTFLLMTVCAEYVNELRTIVDAIAVSSARCVDSSLREFKDAFLEFAETGRDLQGWVLSSKEMNAKAKKMEKYVAGVAALRKAMDELSEAEHSLRKMLQCGGVVCHRRSLSASKIAALADQQQQIFERKQEVKYLKQTSLWSCSFDAVVSVMARSAFTTLARVKHVFAGEDDERSAVTSSFLQRSSTMPAAVHPTRMSSPAICKNDAETRPGFLELNAASLVPPPCTLGAAALALRYASIIVAVERMVRSPGAVGADARDELYSLLTTSLRAKLRARLRDVSPATAPATDASLATEWRVALVDILRWLAPLAHATLRWQAERSFERRGTALSPAARSAGLASVVETLHFAATARVDAAVVEMLVGLNYVRRFEREMNERALHRLHKDLDIRSTSGVDGAAGAAASWC